MRGLLRSLAISIIAAFPGLFIGQTVTLPPINLSGAIGCIGFPCFNTGAVQLPSDADYAMPSTLSQPFTSASSVKFTSAVSLTATRNIIYPAGRFPIDVENATSGGQAINICGTSGACALIPNGLVIRVWNDGSGYFIIGAVSKIVAGTNVTISPSSGMGAVTINASGGGCTSACAFTSSTYNGVNLQTGGSSSAFLSQSGAYIAGAGTGTVTTSGTPASGNISFFTGASVITGNSLATLDSGGDMAVRSISTPANFGLSYTVTSRTGASSHTFTVGTTAEYLISGTANCRTTGTTVPINIGWADPAGTSQSIGTTLDCSTLGGFWGLTVPAFVGAGSVTVSATGSGSGTYDLAVSIQQITP